MTPKSIILLLLLTTSLAEEMEEVEEEFQNVFADFGILHTLADLSFWAQKEEELFRIFENRAAHIKREIDLISQYLEDYEESSGKALRNLIVPAETPEERGRVIGSSSVLGHRMTDRYVTKVNDLRSLLDSTKYRQVEESMMNTLEVDEIANLLEAKRWPSSDDLTMSNVAFLTIQEMQNMKPHEMNNVSKNSDGTSSGEVLNAAHCATIGQNALLLGYYYMAIEWLQFTLKLLKENELDNSISAEFVTHMLDMAVHTHNRQYARAATVDNQSPRAFMDFYMDPIVSDGERTPGPRETMREFYFVHSGEKYGNFSIGYLNSLGLCNGREFQPKEIKARMKCFLDRKKHPYFILNPLKTEMLSEYPYIVQFYDVLGEDTIQEMYTSRGTLKVSTVGGSQLGGLDLGSRTSAGTLLSDEYEDKIRAKTELLTGLHLEYEVVQNVEYVYGRMYQSHRDTLFVESGMEEHQDPTLAVTGDRVATLLYYVDSTPDLVGGETPFCDVGIVAQPVRGSAVFWYNMYRNGSIRHDVTHAACPPLHGNKIIFNQWIRYNINFQTFKCSLNQFE